MNNSVSIWKQLAVAASTVGGVLFGFVTSVIWLVVVLDKLPPSVLLAGDPALAGIFACILGVGFSCWMCGARAQKWAIRRFESRGEGPST